MSERSVVGSVHVAKHREEMSDPVEERFQLDRFVRGMPSATEQWFASVDGFRDQALDAIDKVNWTPTSGRNRIESMVKERGDWCISRQRTWGVPIPVFYNRSNGEVLLNADTLEHIQALIAEHDG